jgi:broad specificity phosphatase PhoE
MPRLFLVRHGQASFGAADYDQLSDLGAHQSERLGAWFARAGITFEAAYTGTLRRHAQTFDGIARGLGGAAPVVTALPGLNEYDSHAVLATVLTEPLPPPQDAEGVREHFRWLRQGLLAWADGRVQPVGMPTHADFVGGVADALQRVCSAHRGDVLMVSSGGPIATAVAQVLAAPAATAIELNLRIANSALTEFAFTPKGHRLVSFNTLPHLPLPEHAASITYA